MQILVDTSQNAAKVFAPKPDVGTVQPGKYADLVVLSADRLAARQLFRRSPPLPAGAFSLPQRRTTMRSERGNSASRYASDSKTQKANSAQALAQSSHKERSGLLSRHTNESVGELPLSLTCFLVEEGRLFTQRGPALALPRKYSAGHSAAPKLNGVLISGSNDGGRRCWFSISDYR